MAEDSKYIIEMRNICKEFPGIKANDDITIQLKKGEILALLGENGAGKSTLMSVLFGLYQPDSGSIYKDGKEVIIKDPNDATALKIGMVHQHFRLVECFTVLDNIILGDEDTKLGFILRKKAKEKVVSLMDKYGLHVDLNAKVEDITVGMQQRTEILKMLYRDNDVLIFDEPTAVLTPQEIDDLMIVMKNLSKEGKSILFISHKLNEIMAVADRVTVLRKGKLIGTVNKNETTIEELSTMMVGRPVQLKVDKKDATPGETILEVQNLTVKNKDHRHTKNLVTNVNINVRKGEIVCIAGIDGNGQTEFVQALTGLITPSEGKIIFKGEDITHKTIRYRNSNGFSHIPEDRHKHGLILDFRLDYNEVLQTYFEPEFVKNGFMKFKEIKEYSDEIISKYDVRSGQGSATVARSMSGGNQQKAIVGREMERNHDLLIAVQPTRGLDVGAIEFIHNEMIKRRDKGDAILLVSLELDEVMNLSDIIYVMYEGEIVGKLNPKEITVQELGLYMAGAKRNVEGGGANEKSNS